MHTPLFMRAYSEAYRSTMILLEDDIISRPGFNGPYIDSVRQEGFVSYGTSHIMKLLGVGEMAQRASWYQKWNLHMLVRPEVKLSTSDYNILHCFVITLWVRNS